MKGERLRRILHEIPSTRVAVVGDVCLDTYLFLTDISERSLETGLPTNVVGRAETHLGGAANVAANCAALGARTVGLYGVIGDDMYGRELRYLCKRQGIAENGLVTQSTSWHTNVYTKPYRGGSEQSRIDLGTLNRLDAATVRIVLESLRSELPRYDAVIVNQQIKNGLQGPEFRAALAELIQSLAGIPVFLDSRDYADEYPGAIRKLNLNEARRFPEAEDLEPARNGEAGEAGELALRLAARWGAPVYLTRGEAGCIVAVGERVTALPAVAVDGPIDPVGAGDSMLAAIAAARAAGADDVEAGSFAILAAGVTVQKRFRTGVATADEVLTLGTEPDHIYNPDLAGAPWRAEQFDGSNLEITGARPTAATHRFRHAIFDHDGTISAVREGWEQVMEPVMCEAILGKPLDAADADETAAVRLRVRELIDRTTGEQTIAQMQKLKDLVAEFGYVAKSQIASAETYKEMYNTRLLERVNERIGRLRRGELEITDLTIKNSVPLLRRLRGAGLTLYLASGTDHDDLLSEAEALGYAKLFNGGIVGSVGDAGHDPKRVVLKRILEEIGSNEASAVLTFGDGPVEIRETRKAGGYAVGVASDEIRRYGLNLKKRERLIRAGAELIIPDYSQANRLLLFLGIHGAHAEGG